MHRRRSFVKGFLYRLITRNISIFLTDFVISPPSRDQTISESPLLHNQSTHRVGRIFADVEVSPMTLGPDTVTAVLFRAKQPPKFADGADSVVICFFTNYWNVIRLVFVSERGPDQVKKQIKKGTTEPHRIAINQLVMQHQDSQLGQLTAFGRCDLASTRTHL